MDEGVLSDEQLIGFSLGINLYTKLLLENKDLVLGLIATARAQGFEDGVAYAQHIATQREQYVEEQESSDVDPGPESKPVKIESKVEQPKTAFGDKLRGVKR